METYTTISGDNDNTCFGAFWIANTITSTFLREQNGDLQLKINEENLKFQAHIQGLQHLTQVELENERIKFRRHLLEVTRQWQREERASSMSNTALQNQLLHFASLWPLKLLPDTILTEIQQKNANTSKLNVILLHAPLIAGTKGQIVHREGSILKRENDIYKSLEFEINADTQTIDDVYFRQDAHGRETSTQADIMNIHFLMGSIPTLIFIPKYQDERISLTVAMWDEQSKRPYIRPLFAMPHDPVLARDDEKYLDEVLKKIHYTISIIIVAIRDHYALLHWGKQPVLIEMLHEECNKSMRAFALANKSIKDFIIKESTNLQRALDFVKGREIFEPADVENMKKKILEYQNLYNA